MKKNETYKLVRMTGMILYIPVVLGMAPWTGYMAGAYLTERFGWPVYSAVIACGLGFAAAVMEVARIIRRVSAIERKG